ncbi:ABC-2 type transport system permease protein [Marininema mesophilum]|uniref:ABC-2 type transport system permease protein n=1 Tax=Marininema mesophilum TaxID=1048340 RepID=A0A1H2S4B7_9BACL|nr:ABC transporter permease [Marininema mesophilum]SDW25809.1 ABC-2 type transport system permease protein [Marininema mesophilum]
MSTLDNLFTRRRRHAWQKGVRYASLIAKTLQIFPLFALLFLYFGYKSFLQWVPTDIAVVILLAVILIEVTRTKYRTFVQPADPYFLFPADASIQKYFRDAFRYNLILEIVKISLWMLFLCPLFLVKVGEVSAFLTSMTLVVLLKGWNLIIFRIAINSGSAPLSIWIRGGSNLLLLMWLFDGQNLLFLLPFALLWLGILFYYYRRNAPPGYHIAWESWVRRERQTVSTYYRFASQFIEVPQVGNDVRPRRWLSFLEKTVSKKPKNTYLFLYLRTFLRYRDPFGASLRLTIIGAVILLIFQPSLLVASILILAVILATGIQLPWIRQHHRFQPWFRLYPRPEKQKKTDLTGLMIKILMIQTTLALIIQPQFWSTPTTWGIPLLLFGFGFSWLIAGVWLPRRN